MDMIGCSYHEVPQQDPQSAVSDGGRDFISTLSSSNVEEHFTELRREWEAEQDHNEVNYSITLGIPYPPCIRPACDLEPVTIYHISFGTHHPGKKVLLRIFDFFTRRDEVCALVKDEEDSAAILELRHFPNGRQGPAGGPLKKGQAFVLKEPMVDSRKMWTSQMAFLRVDHVTDVVWMDMAGPHVPEKWLVSFVPISEAPGRAPRLVSGPLSRQSRSEPDNDDFRRMYRKARSNPPLINYPTFSMPVEVRQSLPGRGFGLFTKQAVSAGDLLLCEKALGYVWSKEQPTHPDHRPGKLFFSDTKTGLVGGQARLLVQLMENLRRNPEMHSQFQQLYRGGYEGVPELVVDGQPVIDTFHVAKVIALNGMGAPRSSREVYIENSRTGSFSRTGYHSCGLWALASRINHCCLANCRRSFIGDMLIVRATQDMAAGTELLINYCDSPGGTPVIGPELQSKLMGTWGFTCQCALCSTYKNAPPKPLLERPRQLLGRLAQLVVDGHAFVRGVGVKGTVKTMFRQLEEASEIGDLIVRFIETPVPHSEFAAFCIELADNQASVGDWTAATINYLRGLELLGFEITAHPFDADIVPSVQNQFVVTSWGVANDAALRALKGLLEFYGMRHPDLIPAMRGYGRRLYSMVVGQETTAAEDFWMFSLAYDPVPDSPHGEHPWACNTSYS